MVQIQRVQSYDPAVFTGDVAIFFEKRMAYTGDNIEFLGYNREPNASTADSSWFIIKNTYAGDNVTRYQLPDDGPQFKYKWDDRATFFT